MTVYHLDFESRSKADLTDVGSYRYASDPTTDILMVAVAEEGQDPFLWDCHHKHGDSEARDMLVEISANPDTIVYAHNANFEVAMSWGLWEYTFGLPCPDLSKWRCTAAMARKAGWSPHLGTLSEQLNLTDQKDDRGKELIKMFSIPPFADPDQHPAEWQEFCEYCRQDVRTEMAVHRKLKFFELTDYELPVFQADLEMNQRGFPVNTKALANAQKIVDAEVPKIDHAVRKVTQVSIDYSLDMLDWLQGRGYPGDELNLHAVTESFKRGKKGQRLKTLEWSSNKDTRDVCLMLVGELEEDATVTAVGPNQNKFLKAWLQSKGYQRDDLQADTIEEALRDDDIDDTRVLEVLQILQSCSFAALAKIPAMERWVCPDGLVRGSLQYYGAQNTGRWSGKGVQPQNFKRPTIKKTEEAYALICAGCTAADLEQFGHPLEVVASCIRHFIQPAEWQRLVDIDFSNIEARIVCWLAGQQDALDDFAAGIDLYIKMACVIFGCDEQDQIDRKEAGESTVERFVGKQAVLAGTFQIGWKGFQKTCLNYGQVIDNDLSKATIKAFRAKNNHVVQLWWDAQDAVVKAIESPGRKFKIGEHCSCAVTKHAGISYLRLKLPSGRDLCYPRPKVKEEEYFIEIEVEQDDGTIEIHKEKRRGKKIYYWGINSKTKQFNWESLYGGKIAENLTQACAADAMGEALLRAIAAGFYPNLLVHDQGLTVVPWWKNVDALGEAFRTNPHWATGLPIDIDMKTTPHYTK